MSQPSEKQKLEIDRVMKMIAELMLVNDVPLEISSSASMLFTSRICSASNNSIDDIVSQFRRCLNIDRAEMERKKH